MNENIQTNVAELLCVESQPTLKHSHDKEIWQHWAESSSEF